MVRYKYELNAGVTELQLPKGAKDFTVAVQHRGIFLWATVDKNVEMETKRFLVLGTGMEFSREPTSFIGMVMTPDHNWVFHVFELV